MSADASLAKDFSTGHTKLVPVIFSHGLTGTRCFYSTIASEMASHGFIVYLMDHHDGSCGYTEKKDGEAVHFDASTPIYNYEDMHAKVKVRENESKLLIDYISAKNFAQDNLFMDNRVTLDLQKLLMTGHSMGGATALRVGNSDKRVKSILTHDPWLAPLSQEIVEGTFNGFTSE